jgi:hypothetical protein
MAVARLCAPDGAALKRDLMTIISSPDERQRYPGTSSRMSLRSCGLPVSVPRLWSN